MLNRAGFTLAETMVALVLTAVIGAAVTGVFVAQSRFFDRTEKLSFARGVSRGATNIIMSEMRMLEAAGAVVGSPAPTNRRITLRVPYALGIVCGNLGVLTVSRFPSDPSILSDSGFSGYAYRTAAGTYTYVTSSTRPVAGTASVCTASNIAVLTGLGGVVEQLPLVGSPVVAQPVFYFQNITYEFKASAAVPGRVALWRRIESRNIDEELVAPFDTTAKFRFYINNRATPQTAVPGAVNTITGFELVLDGLSERRGSNGQFERVPLKTSVFFRNQ